MKVDFLVLNNNDRNGNSWVSIGYLHSAIKTKFDSNVLFFQKNETEKIIEWLMERKPDVIGLPVLQYNFYEVINICDEIKRRIENIFIFLGNKDAMYYYEYLMTTCKSIDAIVLGEGETTILEMCETLEKSESLRLCQGIVYRDNRQIIKNEYRKLSDNIDNYNFPTREYRIGSSNTFNVLGSRGCIGICSFCEANTIYNYHSGLKVRYRTICNILDEIESLTKMYGYIHVNFLDSTFCADNNGMLQRMEEFYEGIVKRELDFEFGFNIRAEQVTKELAEMLLKLGDVGLVSVLIGFETGNNYDMVLYNKRATLLQNYQAVEILNKYGIISGESKIAFETGFINFNPYTTVDRLYENIMFYKVNGMYLFPYDVLSRLQISGSSKITKMIIEDDLLIGDKNVPITNPYAYKYRLEDIKNIYDILYDIFEYLDIKNYGNFLPILKRYENKIKRSETESVIKKYIDYKRCVSELVIEMALDVLLTYKQVTSYMLYIEKYNIGIKKIRELSKELLKIQNRMAIKLSSINNLIIE